MLERLRIQEVKEIILSVPDDCVNGESRPGDLVMVIKEPNLSSLDFKTLSTNTNDDRGFIGASGLTSQLDFIINDGSVLYSMWSYIYGTNEKVDKSMLKGVEYLIPSNGYMELSTNTEPKQISVYSIIDNYKKLKLQEDYVVFYNTNPGQEGYYIELLTPNINDTYMVSYKYEIENVNVTRVNQIHNNIFCAMDIYFDAVDMTLDEHRIVCIHCDKVQIFTNLTIGVNNSQTASFTPIKITSIPEASTNGINKLVAKITVI